MSTTPTPPEASVPRWRVWLKPLGLVLIFAIANLAAYVALPPDLLSSLGNVGYLAAFGVAALANATVVVPIPYYPLIYNLGQAFDPIAITLAAAAGSAVGELSAYVIGRSGHDALANTRFYQWLERQLRHPWRAPLVLFALSAPPNPAFDVAGLLAGALRLPIWIFLLSVFLARIIRMGLIVWLGFLLER